MSVETLTLKVYGMTCEGCETSVINAVSELAGVQDVEVNRPREQAVVTYDDEVLDKIRSSMLSRVRDLVRLNSLLDEPIKNRMLNAFGFFVGFIQLFW